MSPTEPAASVFAREVMAWAPSRPPFQRFDVVGLLPIGTRTALGWDAQKEQAEEWLDVLVGAGLLRKDGHVYTFAGGR